MTDRESPASLEAEKAVLGAILLHSEVIHAASAIIDPSDFFRQGHRILFETMLSLPAPEIDLVALKHALGKHNLMEECGGPAYITALVDGVPRGTNVEHYARIIKEKAVLRAIIDSASESLTAAYAQDDDPVTIIDAQFASLLTLSQHATGPGFQRVGLMLPALMAHLDELCKPNSDSWGERTGLTSLDRVLRGLRPSKLIVVGARPGVGKTSLVMNAAMTVATRQAETETPKAVGVFALEMSKIELLVQLVAADARVNIEDLVDNKLDQTDWSRVSQSYERLSRIPLEIDDGTELTLLTLRAKARRLQIEHGLALLVVDYLQLMQGHANRGGRKFQNENDELTAVSRGLKVLAKDLAVPVVVCSNLSRASESRDDRRPQLSDLRGSGSIEQDADVVILIHRPDMYPPKKSALRRKTSDIVNEEIERGVAELIVAKNRGGRMAIGKDVIKVLFRKEFTKFENLAL